MSGEEIEQQQQQQQVAAYQRGFNDASAGRLDSGVMDRAYMLGYMDGSR